MKKQKTGTQQNVEAEADKQRELKDLPQTTEDVKGGSVLRATHEMKKALIGNLPR